MNNLMVTGGCGFIGANFIHYLARQGSFRGRLINLDLLTYSGNTDNLTGLESQLGDRYVFVKADIRDAATVRQVLNTYHVDALCHFAAESHVDRSIVQPDDFITTNINGTFVLLEEARRLGTRLKRFHHISTDEVYGSLGDQGYFTESTPYQPSSPYSASKAAADHLVRAYHHTYNLPVTISNCSNNYGPYQFPEKLIPLMILNALTGKPLPVYGDGRNVRDWLYVTDHCRAIWTIMQHGRPGATYNVGGRCEKNNLEVVQQICDILDELQPHAAIGPRRNLITFVIDRPGHDWRYAIDCTRLETDLGWQPAESFDSGLRKTIQWYLEHPEWVKRVQSGAYQEWVAQQYGREG